MILVPQAPTRRVTVAELTRYLDIDRKTFYNHFDNIDNLMIWIYRDYLATMLGNPVFDEWEKRPHIPTNLIRTPTCPSMHATCRTERSARENTSSAWRIIGRTTGNITQSCFQLPAT